MVEGGVTMVVVMAVAVEMVAAATVVVETAGAWEKVATGEMGVVAVAMEVEALTMAAVAVAVAELTMEAMAVVRVVMKMMVGARTGMRVESAMVVVGVVEVAASV